jgi:predicted nucleic acid-binding protein
MKVIIDTNIIFSAILSSSGKIGQILIFGRKHVKFYAPNLVKVEVKRHKDRLLQLSEVSESDFEETLDDIFGCINFISEEQIPFKIWHQSLPYVRETDMDDIAFIALSLFLDSPLWTGDKKLLRGLESAGFTKGLSTDKLHAMIQDSE